MEQTSNPQPSQNPINQTASPSSKLPLIISLILLLVILGGGMYYLGQKLINPTEKNPPITTFPSSKVCTEEAKQCPDGSYVGRTGPNCEFSPCPTPKDKLPPGCYYDDIKCIKAPCPSILVCPSPTVINSKTANWKSYENTKYSFSFKYPSNFDKECCNISGPMTGNPERLIVIADKTTTVEGTDKPYDGLAVYVVFNEKSFNAYIEEEKRAQLNAKKEFGGENFSGTQTSTTLNNQQGIILKNYSWDNIERTYIPFSNDKYILVIAKSESSKDSFDKTFNKILSSLQFTDQSLSSNNDYCTYKPKYEAYGSPQQVKDCGAYKVLTFGCCDMPDIILDNSGNELKQCGGLKGYSADCEKLYPQINCKITTCKTK